MAKDYYQTLGVAKNATTDEIKKAYRKLALKYHPDRGGGSEMEAKFKEANEAYQILSDPEKRQMFDQYGDAAFSGGAGGFGGQGNPFSGFGGFGQGSGDFSGFGGFGGGLGDIFEDFFGQAFSQVQAEIRITPAQAVLGDKVSLSVNRETVEFNLPAGVQSGTSFRFPGKGKAYRGGQKGDLILTVKIEMPKNLSREQKDLWEKLRESEKQKKWWN
ncbi:MAG: DnaJ domain-containing protein [Candidatus Berkelbacteria bacterium]|nr:DnaJ domain-containing protein [Candidatus Berkelbacteria bacterium]